MFCHYNIEKGRCILVVTPTWSRLRLQCNFWITKFELQRASRGARSHLDFKKFGKIVLDNRGTFLRLTAMQPLHALEIHLK